MTQSLGHQLLEFMMRHWLMVGAFVLVMVWLFVEEFRAKHAGDQLSPQQLTAKMNHEQVTLIDLRDAQHYRERHILHAKHLPMSDFEKNPAALDKHKKKPIVLVDDRGQHAVKIAHQLRARGFEQVAVLQGGMQRWQQDGMPCKKGGA